MANVNTNLLKLKEVNDKKFDKLIKAISQWTLDWSRRHVVFKLLDFDFSWFEQAFVILVRTTWCASPAPVFVAKGLNRASREALSGDTQSLNPVLLANHSSVIKKAKITLPRRDSREATLLWTDRSLLR